MTLCFIGAVACAAPTEKPDAELRARLVAAIRQADSFDDRFDAEVWLLDMSTRLKPYVDDESRRLELLRLIHAESRRAKLAPELVLSVIQVESRFDRYAVSVSGAQGLMQIMPFWLGEIGQPQDNLFDLRTNLRFGCTILKYYLEREKGSMVPALARYNGSYGKPDYPYRVIEALNKRWYHS
ncbi:MAG TPA: transglycosylase SLT domain-containing protein [Nevskiaceae bacterium]|nr:transglycosylase SLT domain-containing protein [Nevskiaceae bacterium]